VSFAQPPKVIAATVFAGSYEIDLIAGLRKSVEIGTKTLRRNHRDMAQVSHRYFSFISAKKCIQLKWRTLYWTP
jgi:hypothetical protein